MPRRVPAFTLLLLLLLPSALSAQAPLVGPCLPHPPIADPQFGPVALSTPGFTVSEVAQILLTPVAAGSANYFVCASVRYSSGGAGGFDILVGNWSAAAGFTRLPFVDALNSAGDEFACTVTDDLMTVAYDTVSGARFARRTSLNAAFTGAKGVTGVPSGFIDPNFGRFGTDTVLFFSQGTSLAYGVFVNGNVSGITTCTLTPTLATGVHSPSPVNDMSGQTRALLFSAIVPGMGSNAFYDPEPTTTAGEVTFQLHSSPNWTANPDANGGTLRWAEAVGGRYGTPVQYGLFAINSARVPRQGGVLSLSMFAPRNMGARYIGMIAVGSPLPVPLPPLPCLNPCKRWTVNPLAVLPFVTLHGEAGVATMSFPVPPAAPASLDLQGVALDPATSILYLTNEGKITVF